MSTDELHEHIYAPYALDRRDGVDDGLQQHGVMGIGRRERHGQRDAVAVDQQVVFASVLAAVCRVRAGQAAPRLARTLIESRLAHDHSSRPSWPSWPNSRRGSCCHTPARCQSRSRRYPEAEIRELVDTLRQEPTA